MIRNVLGFIAAMLMTGAASAAPASGAALVVGLPIGACGGLDGAAWAQTSDSAVGQAALSIHSAINATQSGSMSPIEGEAQRQLGRYKMQCLHSMRLASCSRS